MSNRVPLDNVEHQSLRVATIASADRDLVNQALVVPGEFEEVQREYPIFIRKDQDGRYVAVALLGLDKGENLFLDGDRWDARYIPATIARGPFFLGIREGIDGAEPALAVHIDMDDPRVGSESGEPLFREHGGNSAYLDMVTSRLGLIHEGLVASPLMFALFEELGLIQPLDIDVQLGDGTHYRLGEMFTIGMEQFQALASDQLERLHREGFLAPAIFIRSSLPNMNRLVERKRRKIEGAPVLAG
ncbi:SapC family protein [Sphingomonas daechungensis]|uniref:SapC family protein n=1 Tax=Sphingomonas daechungensis TaxID=1176646 RepID=UPI0031E90181